MCSQIPKRHIFAAMRRRDSYMTSTAALVYILLTRSDEKINYATSIFIFCLRDWPLFRLVKTWWEPYSVFSPSGSRFKLTIFLTVFLFVGCSPLSGICRLKTTLRACSASADFSQAATSCAAFAVAAGTSNYFSKTNKIFILLRKDYYI